MSVLKLWLQTLAANQMHRPLIAVCRKRVSVDLWEGLIRGRMVKVQIRVEMLQAVMEDVRRLHHRNVPSNLI
jgi:hypothetical protein